MTINTIILPLGVLSILLRAWLLLFKFEITSGGCQLILSSDLRPFDMILSLINCRP
jgi:hypothetical protein